VLLQQIIAVKDGQLVITKTISVEVMKMLTLRLQARYNSALRSIIGSSIKKNLVRRQCHSTDRFDRVYERILLSQVLLYISLFISFYFLSLQSNQCMTKSSGMRRQQEQKHIDDSLILTIHSLFSLYLKQVNSLKSYCFSSSKTIEL